MTKADTLARQTRALELKLSGLNYPAIGRELGCSRQHAHRLVITALETGIEEPREEVRKVELARLDDMLAKVWPDLEDAELRHRAVLSLVRVMDRRSKLLGLDAHRRLEVSGPDGGPIPIDVRAALAVENLTGYVQGHTDARRAIDTTEAGE